MNNFILVIRNFFYVKCFVDQAFFEHTTNETMSMSQQGCQQKTWLFKLIAFEANLGLTTLKLNGLHW